MDRFDPVFIIYCTLVIFLAVLTLCSKVSFDGLLISTVGKCWEE